MCGRSQCGQANAVASRGRSAKPCASKSISVSTWCPVAGHTNLSTGIAMCSFRCGAPTRRRAASPRQKLQGEVAQHQQADGEEHHGPDVFDLDAIQLHLDLVASNDMRWASVSLCPDRDADRVAVNTRWGRSRWVGRSNRSSTPGHSCSRSRK